MPAWATRRCCRTSCARCIAATRSCRSSSSARRSASRTCVCRSRSCRTVSSSIRPASSSSRTCITPRRPGCGRATCRWPRRSIGRKSRSRARNSSDYGEQLRSIDSFLVDGWQVKASEKTGNPMYVRPSVLVIYRKDHSFLLDNVIPKPGQVGGNYDLVVASQPWRARMSAEFKAKKVLGPLIRALGPAGRLLAVQSCGDDPAMEMVNEVWPDEKPFKVNRHELIKALRERARPRGARLQLRLGLRREVDLPLRDAHAAERGAAEHRHVDAVRRVERRELRGADRGRAHRERDARRRSIPAGHCEGVEEAQRALVQRRELPSCRASSSRSRSKPTWPTTS